jgi:hypothetical protein
MDEGTDLDLLHPGGREGSDPAMLGGGGHGTLDALQAVAGTDLAHENVHGELLENSIA